MKDPIFSPSKINRVAKGSRFEKIAADELKAKGYLVWKTIRVKYQNIDLWGLFDLAAVASDGSHLLFVQCKSTRADNAARKAIRKFKLPPNCRKEMWIRKHGFWVKESYD